MTHPTQPVVLPAALRKAEAAVARLAAGYPDTHEDNPWGHRAFKVKGKVFLFICGEPGTLGFTLKLPVSGKMAVQFAFATPAGYGLGKSGWVDCRFSGKDVVPLELMETWLDESFRAIAPKRVLARLEANEDGEAAPVRNARVRRK